MKIIIITFVIIILLIISFNIIYILLNIDNSSSPTYSLTFSPTFSPTYTPTYSPTFSPTFSPTPIIKYSLNTWMNDLLPVIKNKKFYEITIPGSHDSMTFHCSASAKVQYTDLLDSLNQGVRYFDLRFNKNNFGTHGPVTCKTKLSDVCNQINQYLNDPLNKNEIIFLRFRLESKNLNDINCLNDKIIPINYWNESIENILKLGKNLFICNNLNTGSNNYFYANPDQTNSNSEFIVWDPYSDNKFYSETPNKLSNHLKDIYSNKKPQDNQLTVLQWISTGYEHQNLISLGKFKLRENAKSLNDYLINNIDTKNFPNPPITRSSHNVIMTDFVSYPNLTNSIIHQNFLKNKFIL